MDRFQSSFREVAGNGSYAWVPVTHVKDSDEVLGYLLWPGTSPGYCGHPTDGISLPHSHALNPSPTLPLEWMKMNKQSK